MFFYLIVLSTALSLKCGVNDSKPQRIDIAKGRQLQSIRGDNWEPIRIDYKYHNVESSKQRELEPYVQTGISWYKRLLKVKPLKIPIDTPSSYTCGTADSLQVVVESDLLIFIELETAAQTSAIALAGACLIDTVYDQPILGLVSINYSAFEQLSDEDKILVIKHEIAHVLGFSGGMYEYWKDENMQSYSNMLVKGQARGKTVTYLNTPKVKAAAREAFGCETLPGLELEATGGGTTAGSHWEKRVMYKDFMAPDLDIRDVSYTDITAAAFEDMGWYKVDYEYTTRALWGYQEGCEFFSEKCIQNESPAFAEFCNEADSSRTYCDYKRLHKGQCNLVTYSEDLPSKYQYFSDPRTGGSDLYLDYCPVIKQIDSSNCRGLEQSEGQISPDYGEKICENCRCLEGTYSKSGSTSYHAGCHEVECYDTYALVYFGDVSVQCPFTGGEVEIEGYSGTVICPSTDILCQPMPCPNNCSGQGVCKNGKCECFDGSVGGDCSSYTYSFGLQAHSTTAVVVSVFSACLLLVN